MPPIERRIKKSFPNFSFFSEAVKSHERKIKKSFSNFSFILKFAGFFREAVEFHRRRIPEFWRFVSFFYLIVRTKGEEIVKDRDFSLFP